jgi:hypothetical protein
MFGSQGFDSAAYRVKFLHTRPTRRGWVKYVVVFAAGVICAIAVVRPEVWTMARAASGAIATTAGAVAATLAAPPARTPVVTTRTTANAPRIESVATRPDAARKTAVKPSIEGPVLSKPEKPAVAKSEAAAPAPAEPPRSEPKSAAQQSQPETREDLARNAPAGRAVARSANVNDVAASARAPDDAESASAAAIPEPPPRPARRTSNKKRRTVTDEFGRELVHLYDTVLPNGRRVPVYERVGRSGVHESDGWRARGYAPIERRRPFSLFD